MAVSKQEVIRRAQDLARRGQNRKAIEEYRKLLSTDPADVRILHKIADLLTKEGDREKATETFLQVAECYSQRGYHDRAVSIYKQVLGLDAGRSDVRWRLAEEYLSLGFSREAISHLNWVAVHCEHKEEKCEYTRVLQRLVELQPNNVDLRIQLAQVYSETRQHDRALGEFTRAALDLRDAMRVNDFIDVGERVLSLDAGCVELHNALAGTYLERGETEKALQRLKLSVRADPRNPDTLKMLAETFHQSGQLQKTTALYKELAKAYSEQGEMEKLREVLQWLKIISGSNREESATLSGDEITQPRAPEPCAGVDEALQDVPDLSGNEFVLVENNKGVSERAAKEEVTVRMAYESLELLARSPEMSADTDDVLRDGLAEADFFIGQDLLDDATEMLQQLSTKYAGHPEIEARLEDIFRLEGSCDREVTQITSHTFMSLSLEEGKRHAGPRKRRR